MTFSFSSLGNISSFIHILFHFTLNFQLSTASFTLQPSQLSFVYIILAMSPQGNRHGHRPPHAMEVAVLLVILGLALSADTVNYFNTSCFFLLSNNIKH